MVLQMHKAVNIRKPGNNDKAKTLWTVRDAKDDRRSVLRSDK